MPGKRENTHCSSHESSVTYRVYFCVADKLIVGHTVFPWFLENTEKTKASSETFLRRMPRTGVEYIYYYVR